MFSIGPFFFAWMAAFLFTGCDRPDSRPLPVAEDEQIDEIRGAVLPDVPWFELPDGWNDQHPVLSPNAKSESHFMSLAEKEITLNPADGQGSARLEAITPIDPGAEEPPWRRNTPA